MNLNNTGILVRTTVVASLFLTLALASREPAAAQGLTSSAEAVIKIEAQRHVEQYYSFYYEQNSQGLSTKIFTVPWFTMGGNGITAYTTEEENLEYFSSAIAGLLERGWDKSTFRTKNVCVFGAGEPRPPAMARRAGSEALHRKILDEEYRFTKTTCQYKIFGFTEDQGAESRSVQLHR